MRILVTGGAGFIGSHYLRTLLAGGYRGYEDARVTVLDKLTYAGNLANLEPVADCPRFTFIRGDICDAAALSTVVPGHDLVINFAAETHVDRSIADSADFVSTNVVGVQVLLQACLDAQVRRVVHVSTDEVYGSVASGSWSEDAPLAPNSPYAATKAGGDLIAQAYARTYGLDVCITRCCNNYGPYQFPEKVIPLFVTNLLDGLEVPLYGDGGNIRGWVHVDDHCRGVQLVAERGRAGRVYHIGGDAELTNLELTQALLDCCGAGWDMVARVPDRKGHDRRYCLDDSALRALGYAPQTPFEVGLNATVQWYRENRHWWEPLKRRDASNDAHPATVGATAATAREQISRMNRWLVTGAGGMLGRDLVAVLRRQGENVTALGRDGCGGQAGLDVTDEAAVRAAVMLHRPTVVVNCAAWTAVDDAEAHEADALLVNGHGARHLAAACAAADIRLVQVSTDYVFSGDNQRPYAEDDRAEPRTAYGRTKLAGERAVLELLPDTAYVIRTAWLYGAHGPNFVTAMIRQQAERPTVDVVCDQHGQPTWTVDVADQIAALVRLGARAGIYHAASSGETTWFGLAREVFGLLGADQSRVRAVPSSAYPRPAIRPRYTVLGHGRHVVAEIDPIPAWDVALRRAWPHLRGARVLGVDETVPVLRQQPS